MRPTTNHEALFLDMSVTERIIGRLERVRRYVVIRSTLRYAVPDTIRIDVTTE